MKKLFLTIIAIIPMIFTGMISLYGQSYRQETVMISSEIEKDSDGNEYYIHTVLDKQTLFSISRTYGVNINDICNANPQMNIRKEGLKKGSRVRIPKSLSENSYFVHTVKWYETLPEIAAKYGVSEESILSFNGISEIKTRMNLKIPQKVAEKEEKPAETQHEEVKDENEALHHENLFTVKHKGKVDVVLLLPLRGKEGGPSANGFDFYSGALLAAKTLSEEGAEVNLNVQNMDGPLPVGAEVLSEADMIIGPISSAAITTVLESGVKTPVVSPLDPKAVSLLSGHDNLIQAPASQYAQHADLVKWAAEDLKSKDRIIVISEKGGNSALANSINAIIETKGITASQFSYSILEGRDIAGSMEAAMTAEGSNRVIIASETEAFVNDVVRNLGLMVHKKLDVMSFSTSRIRSFETIETENLHSINLHVSSAYSTDYNSKAVKDFLLQYRALFNTEPSQFALQGYDIAYHFIKTCLENGDNWVEALERESTGLLQNSFRFIKSSAGGYVNQGVKRTVYESGYRVVNVN